MTLSVAFDRPEFLWLLFSLPVVWCVSWNNIRGLGGLRHFIAALFRSAVVVLFVFALAEMQLVRIVDRVAAFFLLDQSLSVSSWQREQSLSYASAATSAHRDAARGDMVGVITFGQDAEVEQPLVDDDLVLDRIESQVDPRHSNLQAALRLARSVFPEGPAKRVVLVSDGNQNLGDALGEAQILTRDGIGIDAVLLPSSSQPDVVMEKISVSSAVRSGSPFDMTLVLSNYQPSGRGRVVSGRIVVTRKGAGHETVVAVQELQIEPGKRVFTTRQELKEPGFYTYQARFVADDPQFDRIIENNQVSAFTQIQGRGRVLFVVNAESPDEYQLLIQRLRSNDIDVTVQTTRVAFASLVELQEFDAVVLANAPRVTGSGEESLIRITDDQIRMLVQNVEHMGAGLIMLGGPDSFGAGGWTNSELEKAMPVDFQVKNSEVQATGALMIVIDKSGSMSGLKLQMSKAAAQAAVDMLGTQDQIGVVAFDSEPEEIVRLQPIASQREKISYTIGKIGNGGGTMLQPAMQLGYSRLLTANTSVKHMIVLTDGQTPGEGYDRLASEMRKKRITTTAVAVGPDASRNLLAAIASNGGGKYYQVTSPRAIPKIFMRETRRVLRPLVFESEQPIHPQIVASHEVLRGLQGDLPPITGYILTTPKEHPLVELAVTSPEPRGQSNPLFATWTYGLGRTAVFTTDAGQRWAKSWQNGDSYDQFFVQLMRWAMRPIDHSGDFNLTTDIQDGKLRVMVRALAKSGDFINGLSVEGRLSGTRDGKLIALKFKQHGPGAYIAETESLEPDSYLISISPGRRYPLLRSGVDIPGYREFRDRETNEHLLVELASLKAADGDRGEVIRLPEDPLTWSKFAGANVFRRGLPFGRMLTSIWPAVIVIASIVFFADVANRRLAFSSPLPIVAQWIRSRTARRTSSLGQEERLERLKAQKSQLQRDAFSAIDEGQRLPLDLQAIDRREKEPAENSTPNSAIACPGPYMEPESLDSTKRLLRAKRALRENRDSP